MIDQSIRIHLRSLLWVLCASLIASVAVASTAQSSAELKELLSRPLVLLGIMYLGALGSMAKTISTAKRDGSTITIAQYLLSWETLSAAVLAVPIAWGALLFADQLNWAAAAAYGAVANTSLDIAKSGGRSAALGTTSTTPETKTP